jgi:hypothetical protein
MQCYRKQEPLYWDRKKVKKRLAFVIQIDSILVLFYILHT